MRVIMKIRTKNFKKSIDELKKLCYNNIVVKRKDYNTTTN